MTLIQGGYVRKIKQGKHIRAAITAILILIPAFVLIALAGDQTKFYAGLLLYSYSSAVVVSSLTTVTSNYGNDDEKGTITGIVRSLGALARALGPTFSSISKRRRRESIFIFLIIVLFSEIFLLLFFNFQQSLLDIWTVVCLHTRQCGSFNSFVHFNPNGRSNSQIKG
jgi:MFS family permease